MSRLKITLLVIGVGFLLIQLFQPARNSNGQVLPADVTKVYTVPNKVLALFQKSCYDCHSNNTRYPWYAHIQPGGWWLASHIWDGKAGLNFSEFGHYLPHRQQSKLQSIINSMNDKTMPLGTYTLLHRDARLSKEDMVLIVDWAQRTKDSLSLRN
ncbi:heme-binding domain-containing protein [Flavitalea flava]